MVYVKVMLMLASFLHLFHCPLHGARYRSYDPSESIYKVAHALIDQKKQESISFHIPAKAQAYIIGQAAVHGNKDLLITLLYKMAPPLAGYHYHNKGELPYDDCSGLTQACNSQHKDILTFIDAIIEFYTPTQTCLPGCTGDCQKRRSAFCAYAKAYALQEAVRQKKSALYTHLLEKHAPFITLQAVQYARTNKDLQEQLQSKRDQQIDDDKLTSDRRLLTTFRCFEENGYPTEVATPTLNNARPAFLSFKKRMCPKSSITIE